MPRSRFGVEEGGTAPRPLRGRHGDTRRQASDRSRRSAGERSGAPHLPSDFRSFAHASGTGPRTAVRAGKAPDDPLDRGWREIRIPLVVDSPARGIAATRPLRGLGPESDRPIRAVTFGAEGTCPCAGGRSTYFGAPGVPRSHRIASHRGRGGAVRRGPIAQGLRGDGRPIPLEPALGRAPWTVLARRGALRRHARDPHRQFP